MPVTAKKLRRWVVVAGVLLLAVVIGFFFYGRYRFRHIARDLPARLGVNIQQTATGFSYSQSSQGHTLFTLQASKEFQMKSGHVLLHNVDITLYGPPGSGRTDHIFGSEFDYDQSEGIAVSQGKVRIQLEGLAGPKAGSGAAAASNAIQVQTSGLTFAQKTGQASTAEPVHFQLPRASGSSVGAEYNARTGVLVLDSQVHITTNGHGKTAMIGAAHATMERTKMQALLTKATLDYKTEHGSADQATVDFRRDGTAQEIDAKGNVRMTTEAGASMEAATGVILLNAKSQPLRADLGGGMTFAEAPAGETMHGAAEEGTLLFAALPGASGTTELRHAEFRKNVRFQQEVDELSGKDRGSGARELEARRVDVEFARTAAGEPVEARLATAVGSPVLTFRQPPTQGAHPAAGRTTRISGNELVATLGAGNVLRELDGGGNTQIENVSSDGARETSRGDVLRTTFAEQPARKKSATTEGTERTEKNVRSAPRRGAEPIRGAGRKGGKGSERMAGEQTVLETAVQNGNVVVTEIPASHPPGPGTAAPEPMTAWAEHAEYHAADEVLTLTGHPRIRQGETMQMSAERIDYHRDTQDAEAEGDVKATYTEPPKSEAGRAAGVPEMGGSGPVHAIAQRAAMRHATGVTVFYGTAEERARLWQGPDSLLAPTIEIERGEDVLRAWGDSTRPEVLANFTSAMAAKHEQTLVRVGSRTLDYSDKKRLADFRGDVTAEQGSEQVHADNTLIYLKPEETKKAAGERAGEAAGERSGAPAQKQNSQIDKVVATGHVVITQPGRRGEGAKLVYTADDGKYVLTGTPAALPRLWDRAHGTTTGAALLFNSQNDSVEVSGGKSSAVTLTRAPK